MEPPRTPWLGLTDATSNSIRSARTHSTAIMAIAAALRLSMVASLKTPAVWRKFQLACPVIVALICASFGAGRCNMSEGNQSPQINASKLRVGGEIAGAVFTVGTMLIFLIGIPILRYIFPPAILLGIGAAVLFRFRRHETPGAPWLLSATEPAKEAPSERKRSENPGRADRLLISAPASAAC